MWVAGTALVGGVILMALYGWQTISASNGSYFTYAPLDGSAADLAANSESLFIISELQSALADVLIGAALLAIVVAWADRHYRWLAALVAATALAIVAPLLLANIFPLLNTHPRIAAFIVNNDQQLTNLCRMLPCALAVVMARVSPQWSIPRQQARAASDADMEITRSSL